MQSLRDVAARMIANLEKQHAGQQKGPGYKTQPTMWREAFNRASCPQCQGRRYYDCPTCHGSGLVCPGCRGAGYVRGEDLKSDKITWDDLTPCRACMTPEEQVKHLKRYMNVLDENGRPGENYVAETNTNYQTGEMREHCYYTAPEFDSSAQPGRPAWKDQEEQPPAEPKRGWLKVMQPEPQHEEPAVVIVPGDSELDVDDIPF